MVIKADYGMYVNFIGDKCYIFLLSYILPKYGCYATTQSAAWGIWILVLQNFGVLPSHTEVDNQVDVEVPNRMEVTGTVDVGNTVPVNLIQVQGSQVGYHQSYVDQNGNQMWSIDAR